MAMIEQLSEGTEEGLSFNTPEEEIAYLRKRVAEKERALEAQNEGVPVREAIVEQEVIRYEQEAPERVLSSDHQMKVDEIEEKILHLSPEHDKKVDELVAVMEERGIKNALSVVEKMQNPHLQDDFHRFLVQYLFEIGTPPGVKEGTPLFRALRKRLFEVTLLRKDDDGTPRDFNTLVRGMEQFYAGMLSVAFEEGDRARGKNNFTIEIAQSNHEDEIVFYCAVPRVRARLFEKQLLAVFPDARIREKKEDYNIFTEGGATLASYATSSGNLIFPIKTHTAFEQDPLNIILNSFSKIAVSGEGAAIQIVFSPAGDHHNKKYKQVLEKVKSGVSVKEATESFGVSIAKEIGTGIKEMMFGNKKQEQETDNKPEIDQDVVSAIQEKIGNVIYDTNIRIVASAPSGEEAETILHEIESTFNQFNKPHEGGLVFKRVVGQKLTDLLHEYTFRLFNMSQTIPLNIEELTTLLHFPISTHSVADLKEDIAKQSRAPQGVKSDGVLLGINEFQGEETEIHFRKEDRVRHFYVIGQTGTGKTTILKNMISQDIKNGDGVCMIDPHGSDIDDILANVPPERIDDVIYFDPAHTARPMGLNMLEYDHNYPEQKTFVVNELFGIFQKLYGGNPESMGPMFEQYFRNATQLVIEDPASGSTLLEVSRVMSDEKFRKLKLSRCNNPIVVQFWEKIASQAGGEASLQNIVPYITSKFDVFMSNDIMRPIISQEKSAFNFREIMDERKILLINLSKGRLGDINSHLIGLIIVGKILMAALSRVDAPQETRHDFYLYIDEFQNITTDSIATILSEARKYRLSLNMAHQFIAQLDENIRDAVFGNVGSMAIYRVGSEDAEFLQKQLAPHFSASDIMGLENFNSYVKLLVDGFPQDTFNMRAMRPTKDHPEVVEQFKDLSYRKYGRPRTEIEAEIMKKFGT